MEKYVCINKNFKLYSVDPLGIFVTLGKIYTIYNDEINLESKLVHFIDDKDRAFYIDKRTIKNYFVTLREFNINEILK